MNIPFLIFLVILLVILSAFFSSSETAYATASKPRLENEAEQGDKRAVRAVRITEDYVRAIATILVGNNLVNIAATAVITVLCTEHFFLGNKQGELYSDLIATLILLIFGEIFPKILAADHANRLALSYSGLLSTFMKIFKPGVFVVGKFVDKLSVLWTPKEGEQTMTDEELALVVDTIQEEGVFTEAEGELIKSAIEFSETTAHDILIPRVDVFAYDIDTPLSDLLSDADAMSFSRLPVYRESIDHIIGVLPVKQLMKAVLTAGDPAAVNVEEMLVQPIFVHMTKTIDEILRDFRENKTNMAIVLDEYGGTMGILTVEDILEEIVGEIYDETDEVEEEDVTVVARDTFQLDGGMNIYDVFKEIDYEPKDFESEYSTLSGWITEQLDHFPEAGDAFTCEALQVKVLSVDGPLVEEAEVHVDREYEEK